MTPKNNWGRGKFDTGRASEAAEVIPEANVLSSVEVLDLLA